MNPARGIRLDLVERFLRENDWSQLDNGRAFRRFAPSAELGLGDDYTLKVPFNADAPDAAKYLEHLAETLSVIHDLPVEPLRHILATPSEVVSVRLDDEATSTGSVPLVQFDGFIDRFKKALQDTAAFTLTDLPILGKQPPEATKYLEHCRFLQTGRGSFVANVQLPLEEELAPATFFKDTPTTSDEVNQRFQQVLGFVVGDVLPGQADPARVVREKADILNIDVLKDVAELLERTAAHRMQFSFLSAARQTVTTTATIEEQGLERLDSFISFARDHFGADIRIDVTGRIVELRSRDPKMRRNYVLLQASVEGVMTNIAFALPRADYAYAGPAHTAGQPVRVVGMARRMRTQLRVERVELFQVLDRSPNI